MGPRLIFDQITKRFGQAVAVDRLSLSVEAGEIFGFLGPNGAGKTTAIHLAMGFLRADSGRGHLLGLPFEHARAARAWVGYVPDAPSFFAGDARSTVLLAARLNDVAGPAVEQETRRLLDQLELPARGQDVRRFSRGMQQRLALAQALVTRPELLILDEPTSALDPPGVLLVREALQQARLAGAAVFFSSHQLHEVERLCDRVAFLDHGRLLHLGPLAEVLAESAYALVTLRGLPPGHALQWHGEVSKAIAGDQVYRIPAAAQQAFLGQAWAAGAELVRIEREQRTLEDLFTGRRPHAAETQP